MLPIPIIPSLSPPLYHFDGSKNEFGWTVLIMACYNGWPDIARLLIAVDGSAEHLRIQNENGDTALMIAVNNGYTDIVRELIAADGSVEHIRMQNKYRNKALDTGNYEIKVLLIAAVEAAAGAE